MNQRKTLAHLAAGALLALFSTATWADGGPHSGVGGDGFTRFMWKGTDGRIMLEKCNATFSGCTTQVYGPVPTWIPISYCVTNSNDSYVLWRNTTGLVSIWRLDVNLNFVTSATYEADQGWTGFELTPDTVAGGTLRLSWKNTDGGWAIWVINHDLTQGTQAEYAEGLGWYASDGE